MSSLRFATRYRVGESHDGVALLIELGRTGGAVPPTRFRSFLHREDLGSGLRDSLRASTWSTTTPNPSRSLFLRS